MENYTYNSLTLQLEGLKITKTNKYPIFIFLLLSYMFILIANVGIVILIWTEKSLHQPMYLLFCNLSINDVMGNSLLVPRVLADILVPPSDRLIHYYECVMQAFTTHMFGTNAHTVLMIMAFDRYVAICNPLHYSIIMNDKMVIKLTVSAWGVAFVLVAILLSLTIRLNRCRTLITNPYCDNASLFKLSCESVFINNVYGLTFTVVLLSSSIGSIILTYFKIAAACLTNKSNSLNSKALKTCSTHLCLYLIMLVSGMILITLHRFPQYAEYRKISAILFNVVPGSLNPVIYGLQSREIHKCLSNILNLKLVKSAPHSGSQEICHFLHTAMSWKLPYCGPNVVRNGWCDLLSVQRLVCADTSMDNIVSVSFSCAHSGATEHRSKWLSLFAYISYRVGDFSPEDRIIVSVLFSALTPFLNPIIYSLNKELQESIRKTLSRFRPAAVMEPVSLSTPKWE
ncbi:putative olfactory receptor 52L2 [Larimichthys crocea]|uniref:putative olfactory receptor 52L2 n=1 Tax=Larimichthys crocea TaxID=215358 RepID=UPI000F5D7902|nr:putative olfactory receptor 52L2 [Larimichthys crocea]